MLPRSLVMDLEGENNEIMSKGEIYLKWVVMQGSLKKAEEVEGQFQIERNKKDKRNSIKQVRVNKPNG